MARRLGFLLTALLAWSAFGIPALAVTNGAPTTTPSGPIRLGYCGGDDWEPELARDGTTVYAVMTHYLGSTTCDPASGNPHATYIQVSSDSGRTFGPPHPVFTDPIGGVSYPSQADPSIAVDAGGNVYVAFLAYGVTKNRADVVVAKSTDHGATFPRIAKANGTGCRNCDHEKLVAAPSGLYLAYSQGPKHFIALSTDHDVSWTQSTVLRADLVAFAEGGVVDTSGNVYFSWADCITDSCKGVPAVDYRVSKTLPETLTTTFSSVGTADQGPNCPFADCGYAYFSNQSDIAIDAAGTIYVTWGEGQVPTIKKSPPIVNLSRSKNGGRTWKSMGRVDDKTASGCAASACYALFPTIVAGGANEVSIAWMDDRNGSPLDHTNGFNVWLRTSTTGGASWTGPSRRISAYDPSQAQSHPAGFNFPYGDYFGLILNSCGAPMLAWGEGQNWVGGAATPGHIEFRTLC